MQKSIILTIIGIILLSGYLIITNLTEETILELEKFSKCEYNPHTNRYVEWNCTKIVNNTCQSWTSDNKWCNLTDLSIMKFGYDYYLYTEGDIANLTLLVGVNGPTTPKEFNISFYVNFSSIVGQNTTEFIEKKRQVVEASGYKTRLVMGKEGIEGYTENVITRTHIQYKMEKIGYYNFYAIVDEEEKIVEAKELNNIATLKAYTLPKNGEIDIENLYHEYENNHTINENKFSLIKKMLYCDSNLDCKLQQYIKIIFENDVNKILDYLIPKSPLYNLSSEDFYNLVKTPGQINITYCNDNKNISSDEYYITEPLLYNWEAPKEVKYNDVCNLYDLIDNDVEWIKKDKQANPYLPLMKINLEEINSEIAIDSVLYYNSVVQMDFFEYFEGYGNFTLFEVGDNYIIHILNTEPIHFAWGDCYETNILYNIYKINKKDKLLTRLNGGYVNKIIGKCAKDTKLTDEELEEIDVIRRLYNKEINKHKIDLKQIVERRRLELSNEFLDWINTILIQHDFSTLRAQSFLKNESSGNFELSFRYYGNFSEKQIQQTMGNLGELSFRSCTLDHCYASIKVKDIFIVDDLINQPFIENIDLYRINSDYSPNPLIVNFCEEDQDCVKANCCSSNSTINKNFAPYCRGFGCLAVCAGPLDCGTGIPACIHNKCNIKKGGTWY